jgi:hypothetical protein
MAALYLIPHLGWHACKHRLHHQTLVSSTWAPQPRLQLGLQLTPVRRSSSEYVYAT